jgi:hypothetical protein
VNIGRRSDFYIHSTLLSSKGYSLPAVGSRLGYFVNSTPDRDCLFVCVFYAVPSFLPSV